MAYWICVTNEENWEIIKLRVFGALQKDGKTHL